MFKTAGIVLAAVLGLGFGGYGGCLAISKIRFQNRAWQAKQSDKLVLDSIHGRAQASFRSIAAITTDARILNEVQELVARQSELTNFIRERSAELGVPADVAVILSETPDGLKWVEK